MAFETTGPVSDGEIVTPIGTELAGSVPSNTTAEPSVFDLDENALIRPKGSDKPVKFGDYNRGFQAQATRASQEAANLRREVAQMREERQRWEQQQRQAPAQAGNQPDVYQALRELPYLSGEAAVEVVQSIQAAIGQRDQVLLAALKKIQQLEGTVGGLHNTHSQTSFDAKIGKWLSDGGYGPELGDLAKEVYLAYEGDDLDVEFPQIFADRVAQVQRYFTAQRESQVAAARRTPFVPGKGGNTRPGKPLEVPAHATAREVADQLWDSFGGTGT